MEKYKKLITFIKNQNYENINEFLNDKKFKNFFLLINSKNQQIISNKILSYNFNKLISKKKSRSKNKKNKYYTNFKYEYEEDEKEDEEEYDDEDEDEDEEEDEEEEEEDEEEEEEIKKPKNAFIFFCEKNKKIAQEKIKNKTGRGLLFKELGKMWRNISIYEKEKYEIIALNDKQRYCTQVKLLKEKEEKEEEDEEEEETIINNNFLLFAQKLQKKLKNENPKLKLNQITKIIFEKWKTTSNIKNNL